VSQYLTWPTFLCKGFFSQIRRISAFPAARKGANRPAFDDQATAPEMARPATVIGAN
jgi:hypothetical protein